MSCTWKARRLCKENADPCDLLSCCLQRTKLGCDCSPCPLITKKGVCGRPLKRQPDALPCNEAGAARDKIHGDGFLVPPWPKAARWPRGLMEGLKPLARAPPASCSLHYTLRYLAGGWPWRISTIAGPLQGATLANTKGLSSLFRWRPPKTICVAGH